MKNGKEIRSRVTCAAAVAALAISLINMGINHAGAATTTPETDKAYGIINEDGSAKAGISSIADIRDGMTTTGADFVVDTDVDGHPETVLSPTELRNLLDVSYAADARLETALSDLKTTTESTYAKKSEIPSTTNFLTKTDASNTYLSKTNASSTYATKSEIPSLSNYYTKAQVDAKIASSGGGSTDAGTLWTEMGKVDKNGIIVRTGSQLYSYAQKAGGYDYVIWYGSYSAATLSTTAATVDMWHDTATQGLLGRFAGFSSGDDSRSSWKILYYTDGAGNTKSWRKTHYDGDTVTTSNSFNNVTFTLAPIVG